ncbi:hypothetical protein J4E06_10450 [Muricauda sp. NFXS6]|uniref:hypothetical protein n=1 Tax=Flavobacteriaceae TaxID=49546 RepID=UPI0032DF9CCE
MKVKLSDIFVKKSNQSVYTRNQLLTLKIKKKFIQRLSLHLDIPYMEGSTVESNLCYAENIHTRLEYRSTLSKRDIIAYVGATLEQESFDINTEEITFS